MIDVLFLAVEEAVPATHPAARLAVPLGFLFFSGSVYLLLWSNYGAKKAGAIYGTAFFGFCTLLGIFWWLGAPGTPQNVGLQNLPGQAPNHYAARWFAFEPESDRSEFFGVADGSLDAFEGRSSLRTWIFRILLNTAKTRGERERRTLPFSILPLVLAGCFLLIWGFIAWLAWLLIHLIFLIGFRNKLFVLMQWTYSYFMYRRSARIITYLPPE